MRRCACASPSHREDDAIGKREKRHRPSCTDRRTAQADFRLVRELERPLSFEEAKLYMAPARGDVVHVG